MCEVMSVHWDRLDVKVAVRYPKSYGPRGGKGREKLQLGGDEDADKVRWRASFLIISSLVSATIPYLSID